MFSLTAVYVDNHLITENLDAFDALTGQLMWTVPQFDNPTSIVAPQGTEFLIVLSFNAVNAVNGSSGNTVWSIVAPKNVWVQSYGIFEGVMSVLYGEGDNTLFGVDLSNGTVLWQVNTTDPSCC